MSTNTKTPTLPTWDVSSVVFSCAAFAVSTLFAGGMWMVMR